MENQIQNPEDNQEIENLEQFQVKRSFGEEELRNKEVINSDNDPGDEDDLVDDDDDLIDDDDDIVDEDDEGDADDVGGDLAGNAAGNEDIVEDDDDNLEDD